MIKTEEAAMGQLTLPEHKRPRARPKNADALTHAQRIVAYPRRPEKTD